MDRITKLKTIDKFGEVEEVDYVVGGSCICFSKGNPLRLTLQDLIDSLIPAIFAAEKNIPFYMYFQSYETTLMAEVLHFDPVHADYPLMQKYLVSGVRSVMRMLGYSCPAISCIDTVEHDCRKIIDNLSKKLVDVYADDQLFGLYSIEKGKCYPKGCSEEMLMLEVYRRNLSLYKNELFDLHPRLPTSKKRLTVENTTQRRAIILAGVGSKEADTGAVIYEPAPNCHAKEMNLGKRNHKIDLRLSEQQVHARVSKLYEDNPVAEIYYASIFGSYSIDEVMSCWRESCQI